MAKQEGKPDDVKWAGQDLAYGFSFAIAASTAAISVAFLPWLVSIAVLVATWAFFSLIVSVSIMWLNGLASAALLIATSGQPQNYKRGRGRTH